MRCQLIPVHLICFAAAAVTVPNATADVVQLRGGGQIEGSVARIDPGKAPYAVVQVDDRIKIAIPESQINRVAEAEKLAEYREKVAATPANAEQHYELARWCKQSLLNAQYRYHLQITIKLDPDHSRARTALGYANDEGRWIRLTELQKSRGLIAVSGRYRLPAEVMFTQNRADAELKSKVWQSEVTRLKKLIARGGDRAADAQATLAATNDPFAAAAFAKELHDTMQSREVRLFWLQKLAALANPPALEALAKAGLADPDSVIREQALEVLREKAPGLAIANYLPLLRSSDNAKVRNAAIALSYFPDPELALPLIDALITEHKKVIPANDRTNVGFNNTGGGGMSTGGKAQTIVMRVENLPVLTLLRQIEGDVNYGYDQIRWRQHIAAKLSGYQGDMRRDE